MPANQLRTLYDELQRTFSSGKAGLQKCGALLAQLKVWAIIMLVNANSLKRRLALLKPVS
jgi:hypothetical protein